MDRYRRPKRIDLFRKNEDQGNLVRRAHGAERMAQSAERMAQSGKQGAKRMAHRAEKKGGGGSPWKG